MCASRRLRHADLAALRPGDQHSPPRYKRHAQTCPRQVETTKRSWVQSVEHLLAPGSRGKARAGAIRGYGVLLPSACESAAEPPTTGSVTEVPARSIVSSVPGAGC